MNLARDINCASTTGLIPYTLFVTHTIVSDDAKVPINPKRRWYTDTNPTKKRNILNDVFDSIFC